MLKKERLQKALGKRCAAIETHMDVFCANRDKEALHRLRVEIKKLQAMVVLLEACSGKGNLHIRGFRKLYKQAGRIREAHVNLDLLAVHHLDTPDVARVQHRIIESESAVFCSHLADYRSGVHQGKRALGRQVFSIPKPEVAAFFKSRLAQLSVFFAPFFLDAGGLHEARKNIKDLLYVHALLPEDQAGDLPVNTAYLDVLQDKIGQWHDTMAISAFVSGFEKAEGEVLTQMDTHSRVLLGEIRAMTMDFRVKAEKGESRS